MIEIVAVVQWICGPLSNKFNNKNSEKIKQQVQISSPDFCLNIAVFYLLFLPGINLEFII